MAMTLDGSGANTVNVPNRGTAQNSTSGTSIDFTGIPAGIKRITVMFNGVSTSGTSFKQIQLGSGSFSTSGYAGSASVVSTAVATTSFTTGIGIRANGAGDVLNGIATIVNFSGNTWVGSNTMSNNTTETSNGSGSITLSGTLDRIRITTVNGTDTFDAGSINILYE